MPQATDQITGLVPELPEPSPLLSFTLARERAFIAVLTKIGGEKAALK